MAKKIKVEWCENWIRHTFEKLPFEDGGIEVNLFWRLAEEAGLWVRGTYNTPMTKAIMKLLEIKNVPYCYNVFKLKK